MIASSLSYFQPTLPLPPFLLSTPQIHAVDLRGCGQVRPKRVVDFGGGGYDAAVGLESLRARGGADHLRRGLVQPAPRRPSLHHLHLRPLLPRARGRLVLLLHQNLFDGARNEAQVACAVVTG